MRVLDDVVLGLLARRVAGEAAGGAQRGEVRGSSSEHLVHVRLMARVPHDAIAWRVEDAVERDGEFDDPEVGPEMPPGAGDRGDDGLADLLGEPTELVGGQRLEVRG